MRGRHSAAIALVAAALLVVPGTATAASAPGPARPGALSPTSSPFGGRHSHPSPSSSPFVTPPAPVGGPSSNEPTGSNGDNTQLLGGGDPLCAGSGVLSAEAQQNCAISGEPESLQPVANYSLDQNIDTGFLGMGNLVQNAAQSAVSFMFGLIERLVSLTLLALSLAFGFNLYDADQQHGGTIPTTLTHIEQVFTSPLLIFGIVCAGVWLVYQVLVGQRHGRAVGGLVAMSVMLIGTLFLLQNPQGTIGGFQQATNGLAQFGLGAFSGQQSPSSGSYSNATPELWRTMAEDPWCAEEFGDINWCMGPIDHAMRARLPALEAHLQAHQNQDGNHNLEPPALQDQELKLLQACLARPGTATQPGCTNGELFLSFPTNDNARNGKQDGWTLFNALLSDHTPLTNGQPASVLGQAREAGGVANRLFGLILTGLGMFFFLLLLGYVALNLLIASMLFVILLLFAGVMAIVCCIGDWGRQKWLEWAGMTGGALLIKVLYAMYLGVMIAAANVLSAVGQGMGGWELEWILFAALWMIAFAFRRKLMGLLSPGGQHEHHPGLMAATAALPAIAVARAGLRTGRAVATSGGRTAVVAGRYAHDRRADRRADRRTDRRDYERVYERHQQTHARHEDHQAEQATTRAQAAEGANTRLNERAEQVLNARYTEAQARIRTAQRGSAGGRPGELRELRRHEGDPRPPAAADRGRSGSPSPGTPDRGDERLREARRLVANADERERRTGRRWSRGQRAGARASVEREAQSEPEDRDYESLAYRLGTDGRERYLRTKPDSPERAALQAQIDAGLEGDRQDLATVQQGSLPVPQQAPRAPRLQPPRPRRFREPGEYPGVPQLARQQTRTRDTPHAGATSKVE